MARIVRSRGDNAVLFFQYGQRSTFWKSLIGMDDVYWVWFRANCCPRP